MSAHSTLSLWCYLPNIGRYFWRAGLLMGWFGHGAARPFILSNAEVDFVYVACIAGIRLLARL